MAKGKFPVKPGKGKMKGGKCSECGGPLVFGRCPKCDGAGKKK